MSLLAILLAAFPITLVVLTVASTVAMNVVANWLVGEKHRTIKAIIASGQVPDRWRGSCAPRMAVSRRVTFDGNSALLPWVDHSSQ